MRIYQNGFCLALLLLLVSSCGSSPPPSDNGDRANSAPTASTATDTTQPERPQPDDKSLPLEEYLDAGMPAHDRSWSGDDIAKAASTLQAIAQKEPTHLPRYGSERSNKLFKRLIADENLAPYRDRSLPLGQRLPDALTYMESSGQLLQVYLIAFTQKAVGDSELIELLGAQLRVSVVMTELANELLPTLDKNDPSYPVRLQGIQQMKNGMATVVAGSLQTLTEFNNYRTSELKKFAGYLEATLPVLISELPSDRQSEFLTRLQSFLDDPKMQSLKPELDALVATVEETVTTKQTP